MTFIFISKVPEIQNVRNISDSFDFIVDILRGFEILRKHSWFLDF